MNMEHDIFTRIKDEAKGGMQVANMIAKAATPAVEVFHAAVKYEIVAPVLQKLVNLRYLRMMNPVRV